MPTDRQIARLYTLAHRCGLGRTDVHEDLQIRYGVPSSKQLTPLQYEAYTTDLTRRCRAVASPPPCSGRGARHSEATAGGVGDYRESAYTSAEQLRQFADAAIAFGKLWPREANDQDAVALAIILDDFRAHRVRDRKLSQRQLDRFVDLLAGFPLEIFRRAAAEWLAKYRTRGEKYFVGIMTGMMRDDAHQAAAARGTLQLI